MLAMLSKETEIRQVNASDQKMGHMRHNAHTNISQSC